MAVLVDVEPHVVRRIREMSGWSADEVADKIKVQIRTVDEIESGRRRPTLAQLRKMASAFDYSVSAFLLAEPPEQDPQPQDLRAGNSRSGVFAKETILAMRKSRRLQSLGSEMAKNLGKSVSAKVKKTQLSADPTKAASEYRNALGFSDRIQKSNDAHLPFRHLRSKIEGKNILVFKFAMPMDDARGFALSDRLPAAIVVNSSDTPEGRLFTLIHEFGHILLGDTSIDLPDVGRARHRRERWCNNFASSFLLPTHVARDLFRAEKDPTSTRALDRMSKTYKVSKAVILFRMLDLGVISRPECERVLDRPFGSKRDARTAASAQGYPAWEQRCISEMGKPILSLVSDNMEAGFVTYADALGHLELKSKTFNRVMLKV